MERIRSALGYAWAAIAIPIVLGTFVGMGPAARGLVSLTGVKVSPRYTGGEVARSKDHGAYLTRIHRPVFDGLFGERAEGFVQVDWEPKGGALPAVIAEDLDLDGDGARDCSIHLDTLTNDIQLTPCNRIVLGVMETLKFEYSRAVRIAVVNTLLSNSISRIRP